MKKPSNLDVIAVPYSMLLKTSTIPIEHPSNLYHIKGIICYAICIVLWIILSTECHYIGLNFVVLSEIVNLDINLFALLMKYASVSYVQRKAFIYMINLLQADLFTTYPEDLVGMVNSRIASVQSITNMFRWFSLGYVIFTSLYPMVGEQTLPLRFSYNLGRYLPIMYVFQVIGIAVCVWIDIAFDILCVTMMGSAAIQLEILTERIIRIRNDYNIQNRDNILDSSDTKIIQSLKQCVVHHQIIIEQVECIDTVFGFGILVQFVASALVICTTLFNLVLTSSGIVQMSGLVSCLSAVTIQVFLYCWYGNRIILKSIAVGDSCYILNWYNCGTKVRKYLMIIMERSNRPLKVTAYKFSVLSLASFTAVCSKKYHIRWFTYEVYLADYALDLFILYTADQYVLSSRYRNFWQIAIFAW